MGQKMLNQLVARGDRQLESHVEFLASTQNSKELCYEYPVQVTPEAESCAAELPVPPALEPQARPMELAAVQTVAITTAPDLRQALVIEDVPLSTQQVMRTLIARKLKKPVTVITPCKSIKEFCGGV